MIRSTLNAARAPVRLLGQGRGAGGGLLCPDPGGRVVTFLFASPMFANFGLDLGWNTDGVLSGIFPGGLYVAGVALIGLSLGTLLRNPAGGITVLVGSSSSCRSPPSSSASHRATSGSTSTSTCPAWPAGGCWRSATRTASSTRGRAAWSSWARSSCSWFPPSSSSRSATSDPRSSIRIRGHPLQARPQAQARSENCQHGRVGPCRRVLCGISAAPPWPVPALLLRAPARHGRGGGALLFAAGAAHVHPLHRGASTSPPCCSFQRPC